MAIKAALVALQYTTGGPDHAFASEPARAIAASAAVADARARGISFLGFSGFTTTGMLLAPAASPLSRDLISANVSAFFEIVEPVAGPTPSSKENVVTGANRLYPWPEKHRAYFLYDSLRGTFSQPIHQEFATNREANSARGQRAIGVLSRELASGGKRRFRHHGADLALLVCGEDNLLYADRATNQPAERFPSGIAWGNHDFMFNARHTTSHRGEHRARIEFLSSSHSRQVAGAVANYVSGEEYHRRVIRLARGGKMFLEGDDRSNTIFRGQRYLLAPFAI